jgi:hypothetical protein
LFDSQTGVEESRSPIPLSIHHISILIECAGKFITEKCNFIGLPPYEWGVNSYAPPYLKLFFLKRIYYGGNIKSFPRNSTCKNFYSNGNPSEKKIIFNLHFYPNDQLEMVLDITERGLNSFQLCIGYWLKHFLPELNI